MRLFASKTNIIYFSLALAENYTSFLSLSARSLYSGDVTSSYGARQALTSTLVIVKRPRLVVCRVGARKKTLRH